VSGVATINASLSAIIAAGREITATATDQSTRDTSEFSPPVTVTSTDGDNDGLPNAYESITAGLSNSNPLDAALDNDSDGFSNLQEFIAGTNPNNSASRLAATGAISGAQFQLSFGTIAGRFYQVERSASLSGAWESVALHVEGTGSPLAMAVPVPTSAPRQFFRVSPGN
jgi:hypothetical protein